MVSFVLFAAGILTINQFLFASGILSSVTKYVDLISTDLIVTFPIEIGSGLHQTN